MLLWMSMVCYDFVVVSLAVYPYSFGSVDVDTDERDVCLD